MQLLHGLCCCGVLLQQSGAWTPGAGIPLALHLTRLLGYTYQSTGWFCAACLWVGSHLLPWHYAVAGEAIELHVVLQAVKHACAVECPFLCLAC
jgi:hypothetical protein